MASKNGTETKHKGLQLTDLQIDAVAVNLATIGADGTLGKIDPSLISTKALPFPVANTQSIPFNNMITTVGDHTMTGAITIVPQTTGAIIGCGAVQKIISNGVNIPDTSAFKKVSTSGTYLNQSGAINIFIFFFDGKDYNVGIMQNGSFEATLIVNNWVSRLSTAGYTISAPRRTAYNNFIQTLLDSGVYYLITEMWMLEGGTAVTNIIGFKEIRNLTISGTITHNSTGSKGDGTSGFFNTGYSPSFTGVSDMHMCVYARLTAVNDGYIIGSGTNSPLRYTYMSPRVGTLFSSVGGLDLNPTNVDKSGRYIVSRKNGTIKTSRNNVIYSGTGTDLTDASTKSLFLLALNSDATSNWSNQEIGFASIGKSLTDLQVNIFDGALATLLTALSR